MAGERWQKLQDIFHSAVGLSPEEQLSYLDRACAGDPELKREVEALLASSVASGGLEGELLQVTTRMVEGPSLEGRRLGTYRIVRELGQGGMARVYVAERDDHQFQRRVAIKVAYATQSPQALTRFRIERQILAELDHPHIAHLLDGGATEDGAPYLVLEFVEGEPITRYCDAREMSVTERIEVFRAVCDAVQYAHQNLVVHRDLKPTNILVTPGGTPKLLDFGIAKLLRPDRTGLEAVTTDFHRPMTPEYASPEQVRGETVTTATDVYSLGVVLYELLTGCLPIRIEAEGLAAIERIVSDTEPDRPSVAALQDAGGCGGRSAEARAGARRTTPARLRKTLEGDLDTIVMMALRKAPARRYVSVAQLSDDLRRHLDGRMVLARRDTLQYRVGTFVRGHRWAVGISAAFLALLVGWGVNRSHLAHAVALERDEALRQAGIARRTAGFLEDVFRFADPSLKDGATLSAREMLDRASGRLDSELGRSPEIQAELLHTLGGIYRHMGAFARADSLMLRALAIRRATRGEVDLETAQSLVDLGGLRRDQSRFDEAETYLWQGLRIREKLLRRTHPDIAAAMSDLSGVLQDQGRMFEAEEMTRRELALREAADRNSPATAATLERLAQVLDEEGKPREAEPYARRSLEILRRRPGLQEETARSLVRLGAILRREGMFDSAEAAVRRGLEIRKRTLGPADPTVALTLDNLANVLRDRGDFGVAEDLYRESIRVYRERFGDDNLDLATARFDLAELLADVGRLDEAEQLYQQSLNARAKLGTDHALVLASREGLARVAAARGDRAEAEVLYREVLDARRRSGSAGSLAASSPMIGLGRLLLAAGDVKAAEPMLRRALEIRIRRLPAGHWQTAEAQSALGACLAAEGNRREAERLLLASLPPLRARGDDTREVRTAAATLAGLYQASGETERAGRYAALAGR